MQAQRAGAPSAMPPRDSHSLSYLRLYGSAMRSTACAVPFEDGQRSGSLPYAVAMSVYSLCDGASARCFTGSAAGSGGQPGCSAARCVYAQLQCTSVMCLHGV